MFLAMVGVTIFTPIVAEALREQSIYTSFYDGLEESVFEILGGNAVLNLVDEATIIEGLAIPDFLKDILLEYNNVTVYEILQVDSFAEYFTAFLANICVNIVSMLLVFVGIYIGSIFVIRALNIISRLPILNTFNQIAGAVIGGVKGLFLFWIISLLFFVLQCNGGGNLEKIFEALNETLVTEFFYEHNILMQFLLNIFD